MANGIEERNKSYKGVSRFTIKRLGDGVLYNVPIIANLVINEGIEQKEQSGKNELGETTRLFSYPTARNTTGTASFSHMQPEIIAMKNGVKLDSQSYSARAPFEFWATKAEFAGKDSGSFGFGIAQDVNIGLVNAPVASVKRNDISQNLTQAAWADYNTWRTDSLKYAIGTNMAVRFSDDIVTAQDVVSMQVPITSTMTLLSDETLGAIEIRGLVVDSMNKVHLLEIYQCTIDLQGAGLDMGADTADLNLFINTPPGFCRSWNLLSPQTNNAVACVQG